LIGVILLPLGALWFVRCLAETNRTPFDFAEGESELVSGFNIEYGRGGFALIFIAEYARILFLSLLTISLIIGPNPQSLSLYLGITALRGV
jgi:NADH-ubiquinone oxidoreductase chain 1